MAKKAESHGNKKALLVPQSLVDQVNAARPLCMFQHRKGGCKKGASCPQRHSTPHNAARMPHMSFAYNNDGELKCTIRPPIDEAWDYIFKEKNVPRRILKNNERIHLDSGEELLLFQLGYMSEPTYEAQQAQMTKGLYAWNGTLSKSTWKTASGQEDFDAKHCFFVHGTSPSKAISAIMDGGLKPSTLETCKDPICGTPGVYFISMPTMDQDDIKAAWKQLISSGYNYGAMVITQIVGVPVLGSASLEIVPGMIATKKQNKVRQIAAHFSCIKYTAVVFDEDLLMVSLRDAMHKLRGYDIGMHMSLKAIKKFIETGETVDEKMIELQNVMVSTSSTNPRTIKKDVKPDSLQYSLKKLRCELS